MSQQTPPIRRGNEQEEEPNDYSRNKFDANRFKELSYWANIADQYMLQPILGGDGRVLVRIDEYKSKFACTACGGKGHTGIVCGRCNGTKVSFDGVAQSHCMGCTVGTSDGRKTYGFQLCEQCKGRQGTIIVPDTSQKNSDSGVVLAVSRVGINILKPEMKVLVATYSGVPFKFMDIDFKIMIEKDILGIIRQLKASADGLAQGSYADLDNVGVAHE